MTRCLEFRNTIPGILSQRCPVEMKLDLPLLIRGALLLIGCFVLQDATAEDSLLDRGDLVTERIFIVPGDPARPVTLQVTLLTPKGPGPFPLAVINHGATGSADPRSLKRVRSDFSVYYFLSRGYAVLLPIMRGYAGSLGRLDMHHCDLKAVGLANAADIRAVMERAAALPYIDGEHIVIAGQSFGGWNTLAFGTFNHPKVSGLINFVGGVASAQCKGWEAELPLDATYFGAHTKAPSIWFYGDNDSIFPPRISRPMYARYKEAGGAAQLVAFGTFMDDSHKLLVYPEGLRIWVPKVDAFLARLGMPHQIVVPEFVPAEFPRPTHFATVADVERVPNINVPGMRVAYQKFLDAPFPRAFVIALPGFANLQTGGFDPVGSALSACRRKFSNCQVYAVDDYVSWVPPASVPAATPPSAPVPVPPPSNFAALDDVDAVPYLGDEGKNAYRKFLQDALPRAFVLSPKGFSGAFTGGADPISRGLAACGKQSKTCRVYAVNNYVAWTRPTPAPPPTHFAKLADEHALPFVGDKGREGYLGFLAQKRPRTFVISPDGAWSSASGGEDPLARAMEACEKAHQGCHPYAVDGDIVWPER